MSKQLKLTTDLGAVSQDLVKAMESEITSSRYRDPRIKDIADDLTVAEMRNVSTELVSEIERMKYNTGLITQLQDKLKGVVGL